MPPFGICATGRSVENGRGTDPVSVKPVWSVLPPCGWTFTPVRNSHNCHTVKLKSPLNHHRRRSCSVAHDGRSAEDVFDTVRAGTVLLADRAYDPNALRERLAERGAWENIRAMPHRLDPPAFSHWRYRQSNAVERFFNKLKHLRPIATRDDNYLASVKLASLRIWLRAYELAT